MDFENEYVTWLTSGLNEEVPIEVKAFSLNLFEPALIDGVKFGIELIGAERFDPLDEDWACDEIWNPSLRRLNIPIQYSGENWEECLEKMKALTNDFLDTQSIAAQVLQSKEGVGIGFVDGNLDILWQP